MAGNNGGPWGGGGNNGGSENGSGNNGGNRGGGGGKRPGQDGPQIPELEDIVKKGQEQLRLLMGGRSGSGNGQGSGAPAGPGIGKGAIGLGILAAIAVWSYASFYQG